MLSGERSYCGLKAREDCRRTTHDSQFSKWKDLVGPHDWEDHLAGKEGVTRYKVENLPIESGSGVYELAVYRRESGSSSRDTPGKLGPDKFLVVYVGEADNVKTRLQQYGRKGSHLGRSDSGEKGCRFFEDIFGRGCTIAYRWAPMENKEQAQRTEAELLRTYNYAWNLDSNRARRPDDILQKLDKHADRESYNFLRQVFKFSRSQPRLVLDHGGSNENDTITCGVVLEDGSICRRPPAEGRKRCAEHKGKKTEGSSVRLSRSEKSQQHKACSDYVLDNGEFNGHGEMIPRFGAVPSLAGDSPEIEGNPICGVAKDDGSLCTRQPVSGRKRCDLHKGRRTCSSNTETRYQRVPYNDSYADEASGFDKKSSESDLPRKVETGVSPQRPVFNVGCDTICGVELGDGYFCTKQPVRGRVRCEDHKGMKVPSLLSGLDAKSTSHVFDTDSRSDSRNWNYGSSNSSSTSICGATTCNGSFCQRKVEGNERCWQHLTYGSSSSSSICGAPTYNGASCNRTVNGNGRCWQHSNYGGSCRSRSSSTSYFTPQYSNYGGSSSSICGAPTRNGSFCQRTVKGNGRCWQH